MATAALTDQEFANGVLVLIRKLNSFNLNPSLRTECYRFVVEQQPVGLILPAVLQTMQTADNETFDKYLLVNEAEKTVSLRPEFSRTYEDRTNAIESLLLSFRSKNLFKELCGWRNEQYLARSKFSAASLFNIERTGVSLFGVRAYGCHINGYVRELNEETGAETFKIWIARRAKTKQTYPLMLDNFTGGGLTHNLGVIECAKKELQEEAGLTDDLLVRLVQVDAISYAYSRPDGIFTEGEFVFDLELPFDFQPRNTDGEVECFYLMSIDEVKRAIISDEFKTNSAVVTLNFLMRKGLLTADKLPIYYEILENIHAGGL